MVCTATPRRCAKLAVVCSNSLCLPPVAGKTSTLHQASHRSGSSATDRISQVELSLHDKDTKPPKFFSIQSQQSTSSKKSRVCIARRHSVWTLISSGMLCVNGWSRGGRSCGSGTDALCERMESGWTFLYGSGIDALRERMKSGWTFLYGSGMDALHERMKSGWTLLRFRHGCFA